jgi:hypothetical protein
MGARRCCDLTYFGGDSASGVQAGRVPGSLPAGDELRGDLPRSRRDQGTPQEPEAVLDDVDLGVLIMTASLAIS